MWKQSIEGAKKMRRTMLAVVSTVSGTMLLVMFGLCIGWQCARAQASTVPQNVLQFPCAVEGTDLNALQLVRYEGPFLENRSGQEVANTAALVLENTGGFLESGAVVLEMEGVRLVFELYDLPPGERVLVLEKDGRLFQEGLLLNCYGWEMEWYPEDMGHVTAEGAGGMTLAVTNQTDGIIPVAKICYRTRDPGSGMFLGGISYSVEVRDMQPGEQRLIQPPYYVSGSSRVLYITTWVES